jgi:hypothetical protein
MYVIYDSEFGKVPKIAYFHGSRTIIQRSDGALVTANVGQNPLLLYEYLATMQWNKAIRLCRHVKVSHGNAQVQTRHTHT